MTPPETDTGDPEDDSGDNEPAPDDGADDEVDLDDTE